MQHSNSGRRSAFTLVEILTVIAIIAILSAILFPVFQTTRAKARQSVCLSNLRQIGAAFPLYAQDYDGAIPAESMIYPDPPPNTDPSKGVEIAWPTLINGYVKNAAVFSCPSAFDTPFRPDKTYMTNTYNRKFVDITYTDDSNAEFIATKVNKLSYGCNIITDSRDTSNDPATGWFYTDSTGRRWGSDLVKFGYSAPNGGLVNTRYGIQEFQVEAPATTIHICDTMTGNTATAINSPVTQGNSIRMIAAEGRTDRAAYGTASKVSYRHFGGFDCLYGDGHAGWKKWGTTKPCDWSVQDDTCL